MKQTAKVLSVTQTQCTIELQQSSGCSGSCSFGSCAPLLNMWPFSKNKSHHLTLDLQDYHPQIGDYVEISMSEAVMRHQALLAYFIPILLFITGAGLGTMLSNTTGVSSDALALGLGVLFVYIYLSTLRYLMPAYDYHLSPMGGTQSSSQQLL